VTPCASIDTLITLCPDLEGWPRSWSDNPHGIAAGEQIVEYIKPFLRQLLAAELATKTVRRHRDHLWMLGGEVIHRLEDDDSLRAFNIDQPSALLVEEDGGPLVWPHITESQQNAFDATCRKFYRYLVSTAK
jgi:hypothetical protein